MQLNNAIILPGSLYRELFISGAVWTGLLCTYPQAILFYNSTGMCGYAYVCVSVDIHIYLDYVLICTWLLIRLQCRAPVLTLKIPTSQSIYNKWYNFNSMPVMLATSVIVN